MEIKVLIQIIAGMFTALSFGILFNVRGWALFFCMIGSGIGCFVYFITKPIPLHDLPNCLYASISIALFSEIMARVLKKPTPLFLVSSLIPFIPGGSLYQTMAAGLSEDYEAFSTLGMYTLSVACMLALGIMFVMVMVKIYNSLFRSQKK